MVLRNVFVAVILTMLMSGPSIADQYRPDEFLTLDLSTAVLSPKLLGPANGFTPGPPDESRGGQQVQQVRAEPAAEPKIAVPKIRLSQPRQVTHTKLATYTKPASRTKLAHHHRNPLDAQAFDTRIQVWPCRSGGICNWKR
jgi:hypothetical protein